MLFRNIANFQDSSVTILAVNNKYFHLSNIFMLLENTQSNCSSFQCPWPYFRQPGDLNCTGCQEKCCAELLTRKMWCLLVSCRLKGRLQLSRVFSGGGISIVIILNGHNWMEQMWCNVILEFLSDFRRFDNGDFIPMLLTPKD